MKRPFWEEPSCNTTSCSPRRQDVRWLCDRQSLLNGNQKWEKNLQGLKSWVWLPKFCRTFRVLLPQNPKRSAEFWGTFGSPDPSFEDRLLFSVTNSYKRKTKGQQLKGKVVSALFHMFHAFPHIFTIFFRIFPQDFL